LAGSLGMPAASRARWALRIAAAMLFLLILVPAIDLTVSGWFYVPGADFIWRGPAIPEFIHESIQVLARVVAVALSLGWLIALFRSYRSGQPCTFLTLGRRDWLFLVLAMALGPGLVANALLKDHWGRARPHQIEEFGGTRHHSPPLVITNQCEQNCSFVAGDAAVGFYVHALAYVVRRRSGVILATGLGVGALAGLLRIGMGGHFFSDVIYAGVFMVLTFAALHAVMYDGRQTAALWRGWTPWLHRNA
jgi:lipid A 4'-phosphatase